MDKDHIDEVGETRHRPRTEREPDVSPDGAELPSQVGNRAFTAMVRGGDVGAPAVSRRETRSQGAGPLDPEIGKEISAARGGGSPLDESVRADMEGHLGADLSGVRVHTDSGSDHLNRSVQAEAFTTGSDVFFKSGKYAPESSDGRRLLAHELTHVVQQGTGQTDGAGRVSHPDDPHEQEAKAVGDAVASSEPASVSTDRSAEGVSREAMPDEEEELQASPDVIAREEMPEEEEEL